MVPSDVMLTSNLTNGDVAYNDQAIKFQCTVNGGAIQTWISDEYIGPGGYLLQLSIAHSIGHIEPSTRVPGTIAKLTNNTQVDGTMVLESELLISASLKQSHSSVECKTNGGGGATDTISFRKELRSS